MAEDFSRASAMPVSKLSARTQLLPWSALGDIKSSVGIPAGLPYWSCSCALGPEM